jgi:hypothetical protein
MRNRLPVAAAARHRPEAARPPQSDVRRQQQEETRRTHIRLNALGARLRGLAPEVFNGRQPLACRIKGEIVAALGDEYGEAEIDRYLGYYTRSDDYLRAIAAGAMRVHADARIASAPTARQRKFAARLLQRKQRRAVIAVKRGTAAG